MAEKQPGASWQAHVLAWYLRQTFKPRLNRARDIAHLRRLFTPPRFRVPREIRIEAASVGGVPGEWVTGADPDSTILVYLHGGGYFGCSAETHRAITVGFAREGFRVFAPDYRRAPEHVFPAALDDAMAVYRALPGDASQVIISGESAGGGLALALLVALRDAGISLPPAAAVFSPWTDLAASGASVHDNEARCAMFLASSVVSAARGYLGDTDPSHPLASPLYADLHGLPPLMIHVGQDEVLRDDSIRFAERARAAGVPVELKIWPVVPHAWQLAYAVMPEARQSLREASVFLWSAVAARRSPVTGAAQ